MWGRAFFIQVFQLPSVRGMIALGHHHLATRELLRVGNGGHWPGKKGIIRTSVPPMENTAALRGGRGMSRSVTETLAPAATLWEAHRPGPRGATC